MKKLILYGGLCLSVLVCSSSQASPARVEARDLYRAMLLRSFTVAHDLAMQKLGKAWDFRDGSKCNFIYFSPEVKGLKVADGKLRFTTTDKSVTLGWGNYEGRQPKQERIHLWPEWNEVELRVKQSAQASTWKLDLWANGKGSIGSYSYVGRVTPTGTQELKGTEWQTLSFRVKLPGADGFGLSITGPANNVIEIDSLRIVEKATAGFFRKEFTLPPGKVWRAVADIGQEMTLYVNGKEVPFMPANLKRQLLETVPVDLTPHLKGGKNCIALFGSRLSKDEPFAYLQGKVVVSSGEQILLDTNRTWRASDEEVKGWNQVGFDDSAWSPARTASPNLSYAIRCWPGYDGRLAMDNPYHDPQLYYRTEKPVVVNVRVPEGLEKDQPIVNWVLRRVEKEAKEPEVTRGTVEKFSKDRKTSSLVYAIDAGLQQRGVYTLEVSLHSREALIESRFREPLIVVGKIPMKEVEGANYEEGMDLELEDVIDFTDPGDPHRWVEVEAISYPYQDPAQGIAEPRIIRKGGLVYRETAPGVSAMFSYRFQFQKPGSFYLMVLEYPNDAHRWIGVSVTAAYRNPRERPPIPGRTTYTHGYNSQDGPSLITGNKYPLDNQMHEMRWIHLADPEIQTLDIVNLMKEGRAAAARVRIYRIKELPAVKIETSHTARTQGGERFFGIHTERSYYLGRTFNENSDGMEYYQQSYTALGYDMVGRFAQRLRWFFETCENYTKYLRFTGQNIHLAGSFQYSEVNLSYKPPERIPSARLLQDIREVALRFFEANDIALISLVEYTCHYALREKLGVGDAQVQGGADTISFVSREGKQGGWHANANHPIVEEAYLQVIDDLAHKFSHSPAWKGVYYYVWVDEGGLGPAPLSLANAPLDFDYSDATIAAFEKETGIRVPGKRSDPKRFNIRYLFLTSEAMKEKWVDWRCRNTRSYLIKTRELLQKHRRDLQVLYGYHINYAALHNWLRSKRPYREFFREFAMDPSVVRKDRDIWFGRYIYPNSRHGPAYDKPYTAFWEHQVGKEPIEYYDSDQNRFVALLTCWHEIHTSAPGVFRGKGGHEGIQPPDWPVPENNGRFISQPHGDNVLECYTQAMIGADPELLMYGMTDVNIINSREQQMRNFAKVLTPLPRNKLQPVAESCDFQHNLAIRDLRKGNTYWFYVANPGYWPIKGTITLQGTGRVVEPATGRPVECRQEAGKTLVPVALKPFGIAAFRVDSPRAKVESWSNEPLPASELAHMRGIMAEAERLLGTPAKLAITLEDVKFMRQTIAKARADLESGKYASAWSALTNWRFWELLRQNLPQAEKFGAYLPGAKRGVRDPEQIPELNVVRAGNRAPKIDGKLDDQVWQHAPATDGFLSIGTGTAPYLGIPVIDTVVQAAYDEKNVYLAFALADPDIKSLRKVASPEHPQQMITKYDDTMVIFLQPDFGLFQLAVNAGGIKCNARVGGRTRRFLGPDPSFGPWEAAVGQTPEAWMIEVAIPFSSLDTKAPAAGDRWRANFLRRFRKFLVPEPYWAWGRGGWYNTEHYGYLNFVN